MGEKLQTSITLQKAHSQEDWKEFNDNKKDDFFSEMTSAQARAALFDQPNKQLPRLVPVMRSEVEHLELARRIDLFSIFSADANRTDFECAHFICNKSPTEIIDSRNASLQEIKKLKNVS